ncbi:hypothetical protein ACFSC4_07320 [Deinococcus malanensis]|uniref:hypothetical protein n=1 Tax=Deinococcus malanensis TaxID=1706855 RepID=UPI003624D911
MIVVDTRNRYEVQAGTFQGALNPGLDSFREFPAWVDEHLAGAEGKRIAMFCTGGIRCEKAPACCGRRAFRTFITCRAASCATWRKCPARRAAGKASASSLTAA